MMDDKIVFDFLGCHLQEPMALITNWMMTVFSFYAYVKLKKSTTEELLNWKKFFLWFGVSTFFGGIGHLFFHYFDIPGKFPNWISGVVAAYFVGKAVLSNMNNKIIRMRLTYFIIVKGLLLLALAISISKFVFIAIDSILTYLIFCGFIAYYQYKNGIIEMKYMVYGVLVCLPSIFIFFFKLSPHRWLNKDDLSHLLMLLCIIFFYIGSKKRLKVT